LTGNGAYLHSLSTWRAIIDWLRMQDDDFRKQHSDEIEAKLDQAPADQSIVRMSFGDNVFQSSLN
jgi:hypothetical protein